ncbi:MAG: hypothetical protein LBV02_07275 [Bacteroidales bacterium]|jgi:hypothetical protein|nr:hypothetical protein [Bacteroidales bacterium]
MKKIFFICIVLFAIIAITGCSKDKECDEWEQTAIEPQTFVNIRWKCIGFVNTKSCVIKKIKPEDKVCYIFEFYDSIPPEYSEYFPAEIADLEYKLFLGRTSTNDIMGIYKLDYETGIFQIHKIGGTKMGEINDGKKYYDILRAAQFLSVDGNKLRLHYNNGKNHLLFKKQ